MKCAECNSKSVVGLSCEVGYKWFTGFIFIILGVVLESLIFGLSALYIQMNLNQEAKCKGCLK